ncbi:MAG: ribonuclease HII [Candidatus Firestonebacteria bacterium]
MKTGELERLKKLIGPEKLLWDTGIEFVAGVDEVGRGPLAGPVVAAAVLFSGETLEKLSLFCGVKDSKKVPEKRREELSGIIKREAVSFALGVVDEKKIDEINILRASLLAMKLAVEGLSIKPGHILIDGPYGIACKIAQTPVIRGDATCFSVAAASLVAKAARDKMMLEFDETYPQYGFRENKGYGTAKHLAAIRKYGRCGIHRKWFGKNL